MTTTELLAGLAQIGVTLSLRDNRLRMTRNRRQGESAVITGAILKAVRWHRRAILERLGGDPDAPGPEPPKLREWRWPSGMTHAEQLGYPSVGDPAHHPGLAAWWRYQGETSWQIISGRETAPLPSDIATAKALPPLPSDIATAKALPPLPTLAQPMLFAPSQS